VVAGEAASRTKDAGGPPKMVAFGIFVRLLADAFGRATGHRAGMTWHEHRERYEGRFWELIEVLLPVAKLVIGEGFAPKTPSARGKAIQRWLDRMDTTKAAPQ
jgi:hypothetical protein